MVEQADINAIIDRVNALTKRLRILEEQFSSLQERADDLMRNFMKKNSEIEATLTESKSSFKSVVGDLIEVKKEEINSKFSKDLGILDGFLDFLYVLYLSVTMSG